MNWQGNASDSALLSRAIREEWGIPEDKWKAILARQIEIASGADPDATPKDSVAAFRALLVAVEKARKTTVNIGSVVNAARVGNRGVALVERFRAIGVLGGTNTRAECCAGGAAGRISGDGDEWSGNEAE